MAEKRAQLVTLGILEQGMTRLKREYLAAIAGAGYASFRKAETVPGADEAKADVLYLVQDKASGLYGIWALIDGAMVLDGALEKVGDWEVDLSNYQTKEDGKGLSTNDYTNEDKAKLGGVAEGATKVEASTTNGNVKVNGVETQVYKEPADVVHGEVASDEEVTAMLTEIFGK